MRRDSWRNFGITERYWSRMNEDQKVKWKLLTRILTFVGTLAVAKTGVIYLDGVIAACTSGFSFLLIESQRSYTRYTLKMRKMLTRTSIILGTWCVFSVGVIYFSQVSVFALASTFSTMPDPVGNDEFRGAKNLFYIVIFVCSGAFAVVRAFRDLHMMEIIYYLPRAKMKDLLVYKKYYLEGRLGFMCFEMGVISGTVCYSWVAATLVNGVLEMVRVVLKISTI